MWKFFSDHPVAAWFLTGLVFGVPATVVTLAKGNSVTGLTP
jgi:hypothetical protein